MKLSWYIIEVACSDCYRPDKIQHSFEYSEFLCIAGQYYARDDFKLMALNTRMRDAISANMNGWGALVNHLSIDHGIPRSNINARYDWFLNLAVSLENAGQ